MTLELLTKDKAEFGKELRRKRKAMYKTQMDFAYKARIQNHQILSIERGKNYTIDTLIKYLGALGYGD